MTGFKPGHDLLVLLSFLLFGIRDYAPLVMSAICGVLTVGVVYLLGRDLLDRQTGLLAAAVLATSTFHIIYSRSAYAQADSVFFLALGMWLWFRAGSDRPLLLRFLAGASIGFAFTCHYVVLMFPLLMALLEAVRSRLQRARPGDRDRLLRLRALPVGRPRRRRR